MVRLLELINIDVVGQHDAEIQRQLNSHLVLTQNISGKGDVNNFE